jgi:hypothetical protein
MKTKTVASSIVAAIVSCACLFMFVPTATAAEGVTVTSTKSFPSYTQVRKDLTTEATATSVEDNADWGGIENLDVPQTESQAEKDAAAAKKAAEEEAEKQAEVEAQATQEGGAVMSLALLLLIPMPVVRFPLVPVPLSTVRIL